MRAAPDRPAAAITTETVAPDELGGRHDPDRADRDANPARRAEGMALRRVGAMGGVSAGRPVRLISGGGLCGGVRNPLVRISEG
jgi:hypothetical protein